MPEKLNSKHPDEIFEEIVVFCNMLDFRNPLKPFKFNNFGESIDDLRIIVPNYDPNLDLKKVFSYLNFTEIFFEDLTETFRKEIKKRPNWFGSPIKKNGRDKNLDSRMFKSNIGERIYAIYEDSGFFSWSLIDMDGSKYIINEIGYENDIKILIEYIAGMEIGNAQDPINFTPRKPIKTHILNSGPELITNRDIQSETRHQIIGLKKVEK